MDIKKIIIIFLIWFIIVNLFALLVLNRFNLKGDTAYKWIDSSQFFQSQNWNLVNIHSRWDSFFYLDVAQNGYSFKGPEKLSNIVFFPVYPFLIKIFSFIFLGNFILAGWILSSVFLFLALFYFYKLIKEFHKNVDFELAIIFMLIFPTAFFFNTVYTESIFLFFSVACFYYALKNKFPLAGTFGFLASLTRVTGVLLFIPLIWEYFKNRKSLKNPARSLFSIFFIPLGSFLFLSYHYLQFNDFFLFFKVEKWWGRVFKFNKEHFLLFSEPAKVNLLLDLFFVCFAVVMIFLVFRKLRVSYGLYMLATLLIFLSSGTLMSIGRYILVLFPMYILMASVKNKYILYIYAFASILLLATDITLFVNNYWAG